MTAVALDAVLAYRNDDVVDRFCAEWDVSRDEAEALFTDLLRWLWLVALPDGPSLAITEPLTAIDEMWHTFVLFTVDYDRFCRDHFGHFLHHAPATRASRDAERARWAADPVAAQARWEARERAQYERVLDALGEDVLLRWYVDLPTRFDDVFFQTARRHKSFAFKPTDRLRELRAEAEANA